MAQQRKLVRFADLRFFNKLSGFCFAELLALTTVLQTFGLNYQWQQS